MTSGQQDPRPDNAVHSYFLSYNYIVTLLITRKKDVNFVFRLYTKQKIIRLSMNQKLVQSKKLK